MSPRLGWMGEVPLGFGQTEGTRERSGRNTRVRTVSYWRPGFHASLDCPDWTRGSPLRAAGFGASPAAVGVATQRKGTEPGSTRGAAAQPGRNPRGLSPWARGSWRGAHTWMRPRSPAPPRTSAPAALGRPGRRRGDRTDPSEEVWGKVPEGKANPTPCPPGCLIFLHLICL